jgi:3-oxoacyl-[acyl-carrier-protein] synthase-3
LTQGGSIEMKGLSVIMQATRKIPRAILDLLEKNGVAVGDVGMFLMHQANLILIRKVAATLKTPVERFFCNIEGYGNTSSASLLIAAAEWWAGASLPLTAPVVMAAFGAGFNWGAVLALPV